MSRIFQFQLKEETVFVIVSQVLTCVLSTRRRWLLQILWKSMSKLENTGDGWMISLKVTWLHAQLPDRDPHGDCPLPALPLDHPDHHPAPPVRPQHALHLLIGEPEDDADHETLHSQHGLYRVSDKTWILVQMAISKMEKLRVFWKCCMIGTKIFKIDEN